MTRGSPDTRLGALLAEELEPHFGKGDVVSLTRLKGGYSREMWSFDLVTGQDRCELIACLDRVDGVVGQGSQAISRIEEGKLLASLHALGLPVPAVWASGDSQSRLRRPFLVMDRLPGTTAVGPLHRDPRYTAARDELGGQLAALLAGIHGCFEAGQRLWAGPEPTQVFGRQMEQWSAELFATPAAATPVFCRAVDWLASNPPPPPERIVLVHGDFRTGNLLHVCDAAQGPRFTAILDWEMAHLGDPIEDVAWAALVCWRVGTRRVGGLVPLDNWPDMYSERSGRLVDREAVRIWSVLGSVKMACLLHRAREALIGGPERDLLDRLSEQLEQELASMLDRSGHSTLGQTKY